MAVRGLPPLDPSTVLMVSGPTLGMRPCTPRRICDLRRNDEGLVAGMLRLRRTGSPQQGGGVEGASTLTVLSGDSYNRADPLSLIFRVQFIE